MLYIYLCAYASSPSALHTNNFLFHYKANTYENAYYVICIKKARPLTFHIYVPCAGVLQSHTSGVNRRKKRYFRRPSDQYKSFTVINGYNASFFTSKVSYYFPMTVMIIAVGLMQFKRACKETSLFCPLYQHSFNIACILVRQHYDWSSLAYLSSS